MSPTPAPSPARLTLLASAALATVALCFSACPENPSCEVTCGEGCCAANEVCLEDFTCQCFPACEGKACGEDDGCGNACSDACEGADAGRRDGGRDAGSADSGPHVDAGPIGASVTFKVMDWNVHDFFDETNDPNTTDTVSSASAVTSKITKLAKVINAQAPDVVTLQEVETEDLLRRLNEKLTVKLPNYELIPARDPRGINVGIMSRFALTETKSHQNEWLYTPDGRGPYYWSRDCLEAHLDVGGNREVAFLVNHFISQLDDTVETDLKRQAQAQGARELADGIRSAKPWVAVIITGDLNDNPGSTASQILFGGGAYVDLWNGQVGSSAYTYRYDSTYYRFDYLIPDKVTAGWNQTAAIIHSSDASSASDHAPVVATFLYP